MAVPSQQNMDQFEAFFRRADLDQDGRISGNEAVAFLQGSNLPRQVLAKIWEIADQNKSHYLGRQEFYNALKLVTVAQTKRELTPEIVKAALYGPTSASIPPPRINLKPTESQQPNVLTSSSYAPSPNVVTTITSPKVGPSGPHGFAPQLTQVTANPTIPPHGNSTTLLASVIRPVSHVSSQPVQPVLLKPNDISKALTVGENGHTSDGVFGDVFSASPVQTNPNSTKVNSLISSAPPPSAIVPATSSESQLTAKPSSVKSFPSTPTQQPTNNSQHPQVHNQQIFARPPALPTGATVYGGQSQQHSWPRMTHLDIQKYSKVFMQVDTDRDGRITGEQARDLFLSWKIPKDVLKQVWDLSDQDNDSMLSLREFCIALYLMERYREGRPIPSVFPSNVIDETMFSVPSQQPGYNAVRKTTPASRPPRPVPGPQIEDSVQPNRQKPKVPELEKHLLDQLSTEEQNSLNAKLQEATDAEKKVAELEKEILDAREKIKYYHAKMQELVIYKSQCDNRLNDIYQRVSADKLEAEKLAKKYEEKCRQSGDVASRLTIEESTFRDIQDKKMELYRAISKLEQAGSADKIQERASHLQSDLEELVKSLNERCKSYGLRAKPTSLVELPFGWQPGIQGTAADWEENWDKFEDEGFTIVKELNSDVQDIIAPPKPKPTIVRDKETSDRNVKSDNVHQTEEKISEDGDNNNNNTHDEDQKPDGSPKSPVRGNGLDSKSSESEDSKKIGTFDGSPRAAHSEHGGNESVSAGDKGFDGPGWGRFDNTDAMWDINRGTKDSDSLFGSDGWNLQPIKTGSSSTDNTQLKLPSFDSVPSTPMNLSGTSPQAGDLFQRKSPFFDSVPSTPLYNSGTTPHADSFKSPFFDSVPSTPMYNTTGNVFDSVPSTPMYNFGSSPKKGTFSDSVPGTPLYTEDRSFDSFSRFDSFNTNNQDGGNNSSFSRFDSFNMQDGGLFASREASLSRFDSMRSTKDSEFDHGPFASHDSFARFDSFRSTADSDYNFGGGGVFPSRDNASFTRFDSMSSTTRDTDLHNHGFSSFDDADPFGTHDPFKTTSTESQTPRRDSDAWNAF